ncbi:MAG: hypothetical protein QM759_03960 [Terricaulis sp.]
MDGGTGTATQPAAAALPAYEVGGWLIEHQRVHRHGASPLDTYQGMLADEIVIAQSAMDDANPEAAVNAAMRFADILEKQAQFLPGEYAQEATWCFYVNDYLTQVKRGGHGYYFVTRGGDEIALRCCAFGLKSMLADPHLDLFNQFVRLQTSAPKIAAQVAKDAGYKSATAAIRDLDRCFAEVEAKEPLFERQKIWLKSLRKLKVVADAEYNANLNRISALNRLLQQRSCERQNARPSVQADPALQVVQELCSAAGLRLLDLKLSGFTPLRGLWTQAPETTAYAYRVDTDHGWRAAVFYVAGGLSKRHTAALIDMGHEPVTTRTIARADYGAIVPSQD